MGRGYPISVSQLGHGRFYLRSIARRALAGTASIARTAATAHIRGRCMFYEVLAKRESRYSLFAAYDGVSSLNLEPARNGGLSLNATRTP